MATESAPVPEDQQALEEKIADLHIDENNRSADAVNSPDGEEQGDLEEYKDKVSDTGGRPPHQATEQEKLEGGIGDSKEDTRSPEASASREVEIARNEEAKSSEATYVVPTTDHQSRPQGESEKDEDVPTAIVHENADSKEKGEQQQSKGILQSVTGTLSQTIRSVFGGRTGSKSSKGLEVKKTGYEEQK